MAIVHPNLEKPRRRDGYGEQSGSYINPDGTLIDVGLPEELGDD